MASRSNKVAAKIAVGTFHADPEKVRKLYTQTLNAAKRGVRLDLVERLVAEKLLTTAQAELLREELDRTQIDPDSSTPTDDSDALPFDEPDWDAVGRATESVQEEALDKVGPYRLLRSLGEGAMGTVYLAYDSKQEQMIAVKVLAPHLALNPSLVKRFGREADHGSRLDHPNIVRGLGIGFDDAVQRHYLIMEYVDGPSAQQLLDRLGKLQIGDAVHIAIDLARALEHAHSRSIVHRDIKPENILLTRTGVAKLTDLGLAKQLDQVSHLTATRQGFGTPYYMPYEQAVNARDADARSDLFALGATLYHLLTGQVPFDGASQVEILEKKEQGAYPAVYLVNAEVPLALSQIVDRLLVHQREQRYQTASELIVDLNRTGLSNRVMTFVDQELAMQDPVVRSRAASLEQSTQLDSADPSLGVRAWYLRSPGKALGTAAAVPTAKVLQAIQNGRLGGDIEASPSEQGPFRALSSYPQFREALRKLTLAKKVTQKEAAEEAQDLRIDADNTQYWVIGLGIGTLILLVLVVWMLVRFFLQRS
jgi:serine/threonine-protein kinase